MATILVVDDRPTNRQFLMALLGYGGHRLLEAADGAAALEVVRAEHPDLVITDILMPTMDGFELVQQLRADPALATTPVIFYTATYRADQARLLARACGVEHVLSKPSEPQTILDTVQTALGAAAPVPPPVLEVGQRQLEVNRLRQIGEELGGYFSDLQSVSDQLHSVIERGVALAAERDYLANIAAKFSDAVADLQGLSLRLTALNELSFEMAAARDPERMLPLFCRAARKIMGARYAAVGVLDQDERTLRHFITDGLEPEVVTRIGTPPVGRGVLGRVLAERRVVRVRDVAADPQHAGFPPGHPAMRAFLGAPILTSTRLYGSFYFADKIGADEFDEQDEGIAMTLAVQVAVAYENAQLYDEIQRHAAKLQLEVTERQRAEAALAARNEEIKAMSQQLWQAAKLATMGELAASIAHELNNPLQTVSLRVETLLAELPAEDARRRSLHVVEQELERMAALVANLLQFSRRSPQQFSTLDMRDEIEKTLELVHHQLRRNRITVARDFAPDAPLIHADRQHLRQLLLNLFTNASDAMPGGGTLTIRVSAPGRAVVIEVADTGVGISPDDLPRVEEPFFTTKPEGKGTGLGLGICRRVMQEHGGTFDIASAGPGQGTTVRVAFPVGAGATSD